jgi:hypothetical protein
MAIPSLAEMFGAKTVEIFGWVTLLEGAALLFAVQDFAGFLWTLGAWRSEFANRAK